MAKKEQVDFEEGKPMEEYVDENLVAELNALKIDDEPNPNVETRLETVAEAPIRNEKAKPVVPPIVKKELPKEVVAPVVKEPLIEVPKEAPVIIGPLPKIESTQQNIISPSSEPEVVEQARPSFDGMIQRGLSQKKQMLFEKAQKDYDNTERQFYDNMFALINMAANGSVVPQNQQPVQPQVSPEPLIRIEKDNSEAINSMRDDIRKIDMSLMDLDPASNDFTTLKIEKRTIQRQLAKLDPTYVEPPIILDTQSSPNSSKVVKQPKQGGKLTPKIAMAGIGSVAMIIIALILLTNQFIH
jgi:hypothetical protein